MNEYYAKLSGEKDALSAFGLRHGTPSPPPPWAQKWQGRVTIPSMLEKNAFVGTALGLGALKFLGTGGALHLGSNIAQKAIRRFAPGLGESQFASGLSHGMEGKQMHPLMKQFIGATAGPEYTAQYGAGQEAAKHMAGMTPEAQKVYLTQAGNTLGNTQHLSKAPIAEDVPGGIRRYLSGDQGFFHKHMPTVGEGYQQPGWQKALLPAAAAASVAANPAAALHWGPQLAVNGVRSAISNSGIGRRWMQRQMEAGARGERSGPIARHLTDFLISPGANAPKEIGYAAHQEYNGLSGKIQDKAKEYGVNNLPLPSANTAVDFAKGVHQRLQGMNTAQGPAPANGFGGMMMPALLAGGGLYAAHKMMQPNQNQDNGDPRY